MAGSSGNAQKVDLTSPAVVSRLPTFKGPRDLTLSSAARARRQYVPNIPPKRSQADTAAPSQSPKPPSKQFVQPSLPGPSELKSRKPRPNVPPGLGIHGSRRGGPRGRAEKPELVQSASIFSEGVGIKSLASRRSPSSSSSFSGRGRGRGRGSSGGKPSISTTDLEDIIRRESKRSVAVEDRDIDIDEDDEETIGGLGTFIEGLSQGPLPHQLKPVSLPLDHYFTKLTTNPDGQRKVSKKALPGDSFSRFLTSAPKGTLACLQLPYLLPFLKRGKEKDSESTTNNKAYANNLSDVKGGRIGKVQIRRSGKCYILLGKSADDITKFEVEPSKIIGFRQELAAINTEKKRLTMLGKVQHKFICTPDPGPLFNSRR